MGLMSGRMLKYGVRRTTHAFLVTLGMVVLTGAFFLVLPLIQAISKPPTADLVVQAVDRANLPPPPPPPEPETEEEEEPEEKPPQLEENAPPLDLAQLELALDGGGFGQWAQGDFSVRLRALQAVKGEEQTLFSLAELDQKPRVVYQVGPTLTPKLRKKAPGKVYVLFMVDTKGRVVAPIVQNSTDPVFNRPALQAVKKWKFEPGMRGGKAVRFRMRVPITFPEGL